MDYTTKMLTFLLGLYSSTGAESIDNGSLGEIRFTTYKGSNELCVVMVHAYEGKQPAYIRYMSTLSDDVNPIFSSFVGSTPKQQEWGMNFETLIMPSHPDPLSKFIRLDQSTDYGVQIRSSYTGKNDSHVVHCDTSTCTCVKVF